MQVQSSLVELQLHRVFRDIGDRQTALGTDADYATANAQFGARVLVGPDIVGVRQWAVDLARNPIACPLRLNRNRPVCVPQACDPGWGIRGRWLGIILRIVLRSFQRLIFRRCRPILVLIVVLVLIVLLIRRRGLVIGICLRIV